MFYMLKHRKVCTLWPKFPSPFSCKKHHWVYRDQIFWSFHLFLISYSQLQCQHSAGFTLSTGAFRWNFSVFQHLSIYLSKFMIVSMPRERLRKKMDSSKHTVNTQQMKRLMTPRFVKKFTAGDLPVFMVAATVLFTPRNELGGYANLKREAINCICPHHLSHWFCN